MSVKRPLPTFASHANGEVFTVSDSDLCSGPCSDRPCILGLADLWFYGCGLGGWGLPIHSSGGDHMAGLDVNFVNSPGHPVGRRELPLLQASFDVDVLALLICHHHVSDLIIKDQTVPVRVGLRLTVAPGEVIGLAQSGVSDLCSRAKESQRRLGCEIPGQLDSVLLHDGLRAPQFLDKATLQPGGRVIVTDELRLVEV